METKIAVLADYANVTKEDKLNLLGLFTKINAPALPWVHPQMQLVVVFEAGPPEWETRKQIEIKLLDADGAEKWALRGEQKLPKGEAGRPVTLNLILALNNLRFETAGDYSFAVLVAGETKATVPFQVVLRPPRP